MSFSPGLKALKSLCKEQDVLLWQRSKLNKNLFSAYELATYTWVADFLKQHHKLPQLDTLALHFPDTSQIEVNDPASYYIKLLENKYFYNVINNANIKSQDILKNNQDNSKAAIEVLQSAIKSIKEQKYRNKILDVGTEAPGLVLSHYHSKGLSEGIAQFGWPYLNVQGVLLPGEVVSTVGKVSRGKTFLSLWIALYNWKKLEGKKGNNVLFVSMEMSPLPIAQRISAMYSETPISQLKHSSFSQQTYKKFVSSMQILTQEEAKFYVVDGNLAATVEDVFTLADMLECKVVVVDGAYLLKHPQFKTDRFARVSENAELIKRYTEDLNGVTFASWQFSRDASKKKKSEDEIGLEDIGLSASIEQISSVVLGLFQDEGIETLIKRKIRVMKGRNGETGEFLINWLFDLMDFQQNYPPINGEEEEPKELEWI